MFCHFTKFGQDLRRLGRVRRDIIWHAAYFYYYREFSSWGGRKKLEDGCNWSSDQFFVGLCQLTPDANVAITNNVAQVPKSRADPMRRLEKDDSPAGGSDELKPPRAGF